MTKVQEKKTDNINNSTQDKLSCFVIMPIADMQGYEPRHFDRVYNHIIKPSCDLAEFEPIRADDVTSSNFIVLDILRRIIECDIAICDLSGRNPNVMYELGLRQAFNKKTVLIKDEKTVSPFDVQAFRYCEYDSALRIDNAQANIQSVSKSLKSTYAGDDNDINSIVQLLRIQPAQLGEKTILSQENSLLLKAIREIEKKIIPSRQNNNPISNNTILNVNEIKHYSNPGESLSMQLNFYPIDSLIGNTYKQIVGHDTIGTLQGLILDRNKNEYLQFKKGQSLKKIRMDVTGLAGIVEDDDIPF
ncbi:hypothetical protein [Yokenella regensburgei]|jgi:hypothetical protein|uniref:hypothetical protein n=1 Tax=Yokenella regensburgei TaxID=158877 RepID=UPI0002422DB0|nr:hypothetical protein [Yokenella regensburgei]EHM49194.1 hypothetical protein HMPREF0880_01757 [Yokenella regensburgei ATCC 43003]